MALSIALTLSFGNANGGITIGGMGGNCPSVLNVICPSHIHIFVQDFVRAGIPWISTSGLPGIQGVTTAGMQGAGVKTPIAAAVAAITAGLVGALHIPNVDKLTPGAKSMILACCLPPIIFVRDGVTTKGQGVMPKEHVIKAVDVT